MNAPMANSPTPSSMTRVARSFTAPLSIVGLHVSAPTLHVRRRPEGRWSRESPNPGARVQSAASPQPVRKRSSRGVNRREATANLLGRVRAGQLMFPQVRAQFVDSNERTPAACPRVAPAGGDGVGPRPPTGSGGGHRPSSGHRSVAGLARAAPDPPADRRCRPASGLVRQHLAVASTTLAAWTSGCVSRTGPGLRASGQRS
jgi:hypothetical protein